MTPLEALENRIRSIAAEQYRPDTVVPPMDQWDPLTALAVVVSCAEDANTYHPQAREVGAIVQAALTPRVVTTPTELDALPAGTVAVEWSTGNAWRKASTGNLWALAGDPGFGSVWQDPAVVVMFGPVTVVWTPPQPDPTTDPSRPTGA